jgi:hypothetical protein
MMSLDPHHPAVKLATETYWNQPTHMSAEERMARAIAAAERAMWRPIEEAPKNGEPALVARGDNMRWAVWSRGEWRDGQHSEGGQIFGCPEPTHWHPIPEPPEAE